MAAVGAAGHEARLVGVALEDLGDGHHRERLVARVAQRDLAAGRERLWIGDGQRQRHREEDAVREPHLVHDPPIVGGAHEAGERREGAGRQQLEVAQRAHAELHRRQPERAREDLRPLGFGDEQVDEGTAVRGDEIGSAGHDRGF